MKVVGRPGETGNQLGKTWKGARGGLITARTGRELEEPERGG